MAESTVMKVAKSITVSEAVLPTVGVADPELLPTERVADPELLPTVRVADPEILPTVRVADPELLPTVRAAGPEIRPTVGLADPAMLPLAKVIANFPSTEYDVDLLSGGLDCAHLSVDIARRNVSSVKTSVRDEKIRRGQLETELEATRRAIQTGKKERDSKLEHAFVKRRQVERKLDLVQGEKNATKRAFAKQCERKLRLRKELSDLRRLNRKLERNLRKQRVESFAQATELKDLLSQSRTDRVKIVLKLRSLSKEKRELQTANEEVRKALDEEEERSLCQICLDSPKDTISFPCLHLHYCFTCLEQHRSKTNSCPSCRTAISGVLRSNICK